MVIKYDRLFGPSCQGYRGGTQGKLLYPMVFNVVEDSMIRQWVTVVVPTEVGAEGLGETIHELKEFF